MNSPSPHRPRATEVSDTAAASPKSVPRVISRDLFVAAREIEIEHAGRIYTLRITQANKLILTA